MIEDNKEGIHEIQYPERPNLDFENAKSFYVAGNEYIYDSIRLFLDKPEWDVDDNGKTYWYNKLADKQVYLGLRVPRFLADYFEFPNFDGTRSIVKIEQNPETFFSKKGFMFIDGHLALDNGL